jgi:hypothetical protein
MSKSNHQRSTIVLALLAFANLDRNEEREFITTMNALLMASPGRRQKMVDQIREDASRGKAASGLAIRFGGQV